MILKWTPESNMKLDAAKLLRVQGILYVLTTWEYFQIRVRLESNDVSYYTEHAGGIGGHTWLL